MMGKQKKCFINQYLYFWYSFLFIYLYINVSFNFHGLNVLNHQTYLVYINT